MASHPEMYYLVFWPDEESVSAVHKNSIASQPVEALETGMECQVKQGTKVYSGKIAATG